MRCGRSVFRDPVKITDALPELTCVDTSLLYYINFA